MTSKFDSVDSVSKLHFDKMQLHLLIYHDVKEDPDIKKFVEIADEKNIININDIYPLRFTITYLHDYGVALMTLDNNNYFFADEILSQLVEGESGTKIFYEPSKSKFQYRVKPLSLY